MCVTTVNEIMSLVVYFEKLSEHDKLASEWVQGIENQPFVLWFTNNNWCTPCDAQTMTCDDIFWMEYWCRALCCIDVDKLSDDVVGWIFFEWSSNEMDLQCSDDFFIKWLMVYSREVAIFSCLQINLCGMLVIKFTWSWICLVGGPRCRFVPLSFGSIMTYVGPSIMFSL